MPSKQDEMKTRLADLGTERDALESQIDDMIGGMAELTPEQRKSGDWAADGKLTRHYLALTHRQAEVESEITELSRTLIESDDDEDNAPPPAVH